MYRVEPKGQSWVNYECNARFLLPFSHTGVNLGRIYLAIVLFIKLQQQFSAFLALASLLQVHVHMSCFLGEVCQQLQGLYGQTEKWNTSRISSGAKIKLCINNITLGKIGWSFCFLTLTEMFQIASEVVLQLFSGCGQAGFLVIWVGKASSVCLYHPCRFCCVTLRSLVFFCYSQFLSFVKHSSL